MSLRLFLEQTITQSEGSMGKANSKSFCRLSVMLRHLLVPFSWIFGLVVSCRNGLYDLGWWRPKRLPGQVISVGNITVGGTGKTPHVVYIAKLLHQQGVRVAILASGYRSRAKRDRVIIVSENTPVKRCGDEPLMMAQQLSATLPVGGVPVLVCQNRYRAGLVAIRQFRSQVLILDDGFQHRQLARDLDIIVLNNGLNDLSPPRSRSHWLLPAGPLREPLSQLRRAEVIINRSKQLNTLSGQISSGFISAAELSGKPVFTSCYRPTRLYPIHQPSQTVALDQIRHQRIFAFCGIGNPASFGETLKNQQPDDLQVMVFADHHQYTKSNLGRIQLEASRFGADMILTTEKDRPKVTPLVDQQTIYVLAIEPVIQDTFKQLIKSIAAKSGNVFTEITPI